MENKLQNLNKFIDEVHGHNFDRMTKTVRSTILQVLMSQRQQLDLSSEDIKEIDNVLTRWEVEFIPQARAQMTKSMTEFVKTLDLEGYQEILIESQRLQMSSKKK